MLHVLLVHYIISVYADAAEILEPLEETKIIREGENITLRCIGVGHPPPLVEWTNLDGSISDRASMLKSTNEGIVTRVTVDLIFTRAFRDDTGVYECLVSNLLNIATGNVSLTVQCMQVVKSSSIICFQLLN